MAVEEDGHRRLLGDLAWIRHRYMDTPWLSTTMQVVLGGDPLSADPQALRQMRVLETWIGGVKVYDVDGGAQLARPPSAQGPDGSPQGRARPAEAPGR